MVEPKLIAFSALLGGISSYMLLRRRKGSKISREEAEAAAQAQEAEQKRIKHLLNHARKMDEAYEGLNRKMTEALVAREAAFKEYERKEKERIAKLEERRRNPGKQRTLSESSSLKSITSTLSDRTYIYDGLYYKSMGFSDEEDEELEFILSDFPFVDSAEEDKEVRRKLLTHAIADVAKVILKLPYLPIRLVVCPRDSDLGEVKEDVNLETDKPRGKASEFCKVGDMVRDTGYGALVYRQLLPKKIPSTMAELLGHNDISSKEEHDRTWFLVELLGALKPRKIAVLMESRDTAPSDMPIDPERCLVPAKKMPIVIAGAKVFRSQKRALEDFEIGPYLPISQHCNSKYHFAFAEWRIKKLTVWYEGITGEAPGQPLRDTSGSKLVPNIMFDPSYGFLRMMAGTQADDSAKPRDRGTEIILVVKDEMHIDSFRQEIEWLAKQTVPYQQLKVGGLDPLARLELFRAKVFYTASTEANQVVKRVWSTEVASPPRVKT
ncbi:hypothetical protein QFC19_002653 [Naganishia cerealis]|uniref:Uncharacterized protein n=1 Tax=Naganishia cerealis TaxID=610337 RepID=A0ACC2W9Y5_9TREE|nr:hypothetical protein QFC19_002653 [Naganishia cerealis]